MLTLEECKKILNNPELKDEEVLEIRNILTCISKNIINKYVEDRKKATRTNLLSRII